jgi:hypothetical protein
LVLVVQDTDLVLVLVVLVVLPMALVLLEEGHLVVLLLVLDKEVEALVWESNHPNQR